MWDERYREPEFAYGKEANQFLQEQLVTLPVGKILFPCEGEGRNAVFAAQKGWEVAAFDASQEGLKKATSLAAERLVAIEYQIGDALHIEYPIGSFDAIALVYAHFPSEIRQSLHQKFVTWLKPGGVILLEAFHPNQLQNSSGGPKLSSMLLTPEILEDDFATLETVLVGTATIVLDEGKYHQGKADVVRYVGKKATG
jgi:ubiquinone/menaquinone biosynthesis C-methylase UbiE